MRKNEIHILWDNSHIWGLMALRTLRFLGLKTKLIKAIEIAQGEHLGKTEPAKGPLLLVPGGNARQKAMALGAAGFSAIRAWLMRGGIYLGFCGGAGLALTTEDPELSLGLCPWRRGAYPHRMGHMISGHLLASDQSGATLPMPVWWPGRFETSHTDSVQVLASYVRPENDLWLADLPIADLPSCVLHSLQTRCHMACIPDYPSGQPLAISCKFGSGHCILSYAHLETPDSAPANAWLLKLLDSLGIYPQSSAILRTGWDTSAKFPRPANRLESFVQLAHENMKSLIALGENAGLLFRRTPWLWGWRTGIAGMACNNLLAALAFLREFPPAAGARKWWEKNEGATITAMERFFAEAWSLLWRTRMENTLEWRQPDSQKMLKAAQMRIFGHPRLGGGLAGIALDLLCEIIFLSDQEYCQTKIN